MLLPVGQNQPARRAGRPTGDHTAKRAELLRAATTVIAEEGFANASLRKVAMRAGCTTGAVTYYFANKDDLVRQLVESRFDGFDAMVETRLGDAGIRGLLEAWLTTITDDTEFWPVMFELLAHARHNPPFAALIEARYARFRERCTALLAEGQTGGTVRDDIPAELLADQLSAIGDGWMLMLPIEPGRFTPARTRTLIDATVALIAPPKQRRRPTRT